ncbi:MAG: hypothetical protein JO342_04785 [Solirubrobacterales bacterium]|nr:hypothetical protein [Solirubrobacterales bacterium]
MQTRTRHLLRVDPHEPAISRPGFLRGWSGYFRYGNSDHSFDKISHYATDRLARFVGKRHKRGWGYGMNVVAYQSHNRLGLINLNGPSSRHDPTGRGDRDTECPPVKNAGEPCAGKAHAQFDVGGGRKPGQSAKNARPRRLPPTLPRPCRSRSGPPITVPLEVKPVTDGSRARPP